jgi:hypothetical protein
MAVARIAWLQFDDQPAIQKQLIQILDKHPHRDIYLAADAPDGVALENWIFLRAATWPDWVRDPQAPKGKPPFTKQEIHDIKAYDKPAWHFVNLPYIHPDDIKNFDAVALRQQILVPEFDGKQQPRHAIAALKRCLAMLRANDTSDPDKAVCLCWILHLIGDLHQPLHASALIASEERFGAPFLPPHGDKGGNQLAIKMRLKMRSSQRRCTLIGTPCSSAARRPSTKWTPRSPSFSVKTT